MSPMSAMTSTSPSKPPSGNVWAVRRSSISSTARTRVDSSRSARAPTSGTGRPSRPGYHRVTRAAANEPQRQGDVGGVRRRRQVAVDAQHHRRGPLGPQPAAGVGHHDRATPALAPLPLPPPVAVTGHVPRAQRGRTAVPDAAMVPPPSVCAVPAATGTASVPA